MTRSYAEEDYVKKGLASLAVAQSAAAGSVAQIDSNGELTLGSGASSSSTVNVKTTYGAAGDYSGSTGTDDTAAIQAALNAAAAAGGGIVFFPPGRYYTKELTVTGNGVTLLGTGFGDTASGGFGAMLVGHADLVTDVLTVSGSKCSVRQMTLSGNGHGRDVLRLTNTAGRFVGDSLQIQSAGTGNGITHGTSVTSVTAKWSNLFVSNCGGHGILVNSSDTEWVNVTTFSNTGDGFKFLGTAANVANLHTWGNTGAGLNLSGAGSRITNLYSETNTGNGIDVLTSSGIYNTISNGLVKANQIGVNINTSAKRTGLSNVKVVNNKAEGVYIQSGDYCQLANIDCFDDQGGKTQTYGIRIAAGVVSTSIVGRLPYIADHVTGGLLDAGTATEINNWVTLKKASDLPVTSNNTIATDTDFTLAVGAGETWEIEGTLFADGAQTGDFQMRLAVPSLGAGFWHILGPAASAASTSSVSILPLGQAFNTTQSVGMVGTGLITPIRVSGILTVGVTGGSFLLRWSQANSDGTATVLHAGSFLRLRRIS